jgi:hypothetical protein
LNTLDQQNDPLPIIAERRRHDRSRVLLRGLVVARNGALTWDCLIKDRSNVGAKIRLPEGLCIPEHCIFSSRRDKIARRAVVQWVRAPFFGLRFLLP